MRRVVAALIGFAFVGLLSPRPVLTAQKVTELARILAEDSSYKVRVQAALVLGKLADRDAVPALVKALKDNNNTVRAVAAQSLGRIGAPEAVTELRNALKTEHDKFVRTQIERALATLEKPATAAGGNSTRGIYIELGTFSGGVRAAGAPVIELFREGLRKKLSSLERLTFSLPEHERANFEKSGRHGFLIDGNVTRLDTARVGGALETNCDVKVMVARWPSKSLILWTSAGAAVQGGARERDKDIAVRDCLEASAEQVGEDLKRFFESQGS